MRSLRLSLLLAVGVAAAGCSQPPPTRQIDFQGIIQNAQEKVYPALVYVKPIKETFRRGERMRAEVFGSGVIIRPEGYVVTNHHVAEKAIEINCVLGDREQVPATVVGLDPETDLALLKLQLPKNHPPLAKVASFGDSDKVEAGQFVMALGSPFGFTRSISLGIVSNTKRYIGFTTVYGYNLWLQTDAAINPGNSGGPLVDTRGEIIGINTLGTWAEGIGFAIPSNVVQDVVNRLLAESERTPKEKWPVKVARAYTGLQLQALNDFNSNTFTDSRHGVLVQSVDVGAPAEKAGIRNGDILLQVNGEMIEGAYVEDLPSLRVMLADLPVDRPAKVLIGRRAAPRGTTTRPVSAAPRAPAVGNPASSGPALQPVNPPGGLDPAGIGHRQVFELTLAPIIRGKFEGEDLDLRKWNLTVKEITKFSNPALHFLHPEGGVFIQGIRRPGNAGDAGLQYNDVILQIGRTKMKTLADIKKAYDELVNDKALTEKKVLITVKRGGFLEWKTLNWQKDYLRED